MLDKCVFGECYIHGGKLNLLMSKYTPLVNSTSNDKIFTADCIIKKQPFDSICRIGDRESISNCSYFSDLRNFHKFIKTTGPLSFNELRNTPISGFY